MSPENPEASSLSNSNTSVAHRSTDQWPNQDLCIDQRIKEIILATNKPKKRAGRKIFKETRHPIFRGVRRKNKNKWVCELREPNKKTRIWLGTYPTPEMAARAHDVAALAFRGKFICLNFADSTWRLPVPASRDAKDIIKTAAEAAEMFRPQEFEEARNGHVTVLKSSIKDYNSGVISGHVDKVEGAKDSKENLFSPENLFYMDEEVVFNMPGLLMGLAEGLMLSPPLMVNDEEFSNLDVSPWSYSI